MWEWAESRGNEANVGQVWRKKKQTSRWGVKKEKQWRSRKSRSSKNEERKRNHNEEPNKKVKTLKCCSDLCLSLDICSFYPKLFMGLEFKICVRKKRKKLQSNPMVLKVRGRTLVAEHGIIKGGPTGPINCFFQLICAIFNLIVYPISIKLLQLFTIIFKF